MPSLTLLHSSTPEPCAFPSPNLAHFVITSEIEPSALPRILENFALRNLTPHHMEVQQGGDQLHISLSVAGLTTQERDHLHLRLLNILPVLSVDLQTP